MQSGFEHRRNDVQKTEHPFMDGEFFEVKRGKFELDPCSNSGQPSIWGLSHRVFFFGVGEDTFNGLGAQCVGLFAQRRMADILCLFNVILPDMPGYGFHTLLILGTLFSYRTILADIAFAFVLSVSFSVCG